MSAVGFIGLGQIGAPMARHLLDWPGELTVCDAVREAVTPFEAAGARVAADPAEVAQHADVVSVMVRDDDQVRAVVGELLDTARRGSVIAIHSTISLATALDLADQAAGGGVDVVDAPVSGGAMGAHAGTLAALVGGTDEAVERCRPVFERWAGLVAHLGPVGAGTKAKLARNLLHFCAFAAAGEAQRLAQAAGLDLRLLGEIVRHSDAVTGGPGAIMLRGTTDPIPVGDPLRPVFEHALALGSKDLRLALELGEQLEVELPLARLALDHLAGALGVPDAEATR